MRERVILLHGIWMRGFMMTRLARRLDEQGFEPKIVEYASLVRGADASASALRERWLADPGQTVHVVGHSLGGVVALLATQGVSVPGRNVCLGSPLQGSDAARTLARFAPWMLGQSRERLLSGLAPWCGPRETAVIAGRVPVGLALLVGGLAGDHDGTVRVEETRLPGIHDHAVVSATHSGLPFSDEVIDMTAQFLRHGRLRVA